MQMSPTDSDNIFKNIKNHNLRPNLWQNSSVVGLAPKKFDVWRLNLLHFIRRVFVFQIVYDMIRLCSARSYYIQITSNVMEPFSHFFYSKKLTTFWSELTWFNLNPSMDK